MVQVRSHSDPAEKLSPIFKLTLESGNSGPAATVTLPKGFDRVGVSSGRRRKVLAHFWQKLNVDEPLDRLERMQRKIFRDI